MGRQRQALAVTGSFRTKLRPGSTPGRFVFFWHNLGARQGLFGGRRETRDLDFLLPVSVRNRLARPERLDSRAFFYHLCHTVVDRHRDRSRCWRRPFIQRRAKGRFSRGLCAKRRFERERFREIAGCRCTGWCTDCEDFRGRHTATDRDQPRSTCGKRWTLVSWNQRPRKIRLRIRGKSKNHPR